MKRGLPGWPRLPAWFVALAVLAGLAWTGLLAREHVNGAASVLDRFETVLLDLRIALTGTRTPPDNIVIVAIDDRALGVTGQYPLPRDTLAKVIGKISEAGARTLVTDILLSGASDPEKDRALARALLGIPTVLAAAGQAREAMPSSDTAPVNFVPVITSVLSPAPALTDVAAVGLANIVTDAGGTPRHIPLLFMTPNGLQQSFSLRGAGLYLQELPEITASGLRLGDRNRPLDLGWHLALNYYGPGGTIPTISAKTVLDGAPEVMARLKGRLVVLGVDATAVGDRFATPFDPVMPGVEVQATGIANLIDGTHLIRTADTRMADAAAAAIITLVGLAAIVFLPLAPASIVYLVLLAGWLGVIAVLFGQGYWLNGALPFAASLPPVIGLIIARQVADRTQARRLLQAQEALGRFQSPGLAKRIAEDPSFLVEPRQQDVAILFLDLTGYTGLSERLGAAKARDFLKEFHTIVVNVANGRDGIVLDFMGDGAMLGFGIPDSDPKDTVNAFACAFLLEQEIADWLDARGMGTGNVRIGGHVGSVVLSRLGHDTQQQIAATGDSVNVASRLLEVAKEHGAAIALSRKLIQEVEKTTVLDIHVPRRGTVAIRGRQMELQVGLWKAEETAAGLERLVGSQGSL